MKNLVSTYIIFLSLLRAQLVPSLSRSIEGLYLGDCYNDPLPRWNFIDHDEAIK